MALEVPFIHSLTAEGTPSPVNFNDVFTFEKSDVQVGIAKHSIIFYRDENSVGPKAIEWKYKKICDRNAEYDKVIALISKPI